eukprot:jgi/Botrbrau1/3321/Bobra.0048s0017.1
MGSLASENNTVQAVSYRPGGWPRALRRSPPPQQTGPGWAEGLGLKTFACPNIHSS